MNESASVGRSVHGKGALREKPLQGIVLATVSNSAPQKETPRCECSGAFLKIA